MESGKCSGEKMIDSHRIPSADPGEFLSDHWSVQRDIGFPESKTDEIERRIKMTGKNGDIKLWVIRHGYRIDFYDPH